MLDITHPNRIHIRGIKQDLWKEDMIADPQVRIQYASKFSRSSNYWKYSIGQSKGLKKLDVVSKKREQEEAFTRWLRMDPDREELYGDALPAIRDVISGRRELMHAEQYLNETMRLGNGMESVYFARHLELLERALAMEDEDPMVVARVLPMLHELARNFYKDYHPPTDKKVMGAMIDLLIKELDDEYLPFTIREVKEKYKGNTEKYVSRYFKKSFVVDQKKFLDFLANPSLKKLRKDPAYVANIAAKVHLEVQGKLNQFTPDYERGSRLYLKGLMEMEEGKEFYSDANSTLRLNYGKVGDYKARDAVYYDYYTTLTGVMEKEDPGSIEFTVPEKLKSLYVAKDYGPYGQQDTMRVCFISNNDITGGNSGSPIINAEGQLIGLAFDGNWEAMSGDVAFEPEIQKCINVDIRYVLFIMDKFAGAKHLVDEMTLTW
jgi:hypothetical protein